MFPSVRALLTGVIDYAGLFPPAQLPMEQAIRNYVRYQTEPESWMLGRFICPAARLAELSSMRDLFAKLTRPLVVSALGRGGKDTEGFLVGLREDLKDIAVFRKTHDHRVEVDVYEAKLPIDLFGSAKSNGKPLALIEQAKQLIDEAGPPHLTPFYEAVLVGADWLIPIEMTVAAIAASAKARRGLRCEPGGFKLRCGGVDASAFPSSSQVVAALLACRDTNVPLKFTAGLHHPVRRYDTSVQTKMHGFLNLFVASVLNNQITLEQMQQLVEDEDATHFFFSEDGLGWNDVRVPISVIDQARKNSVISFGSCSFDEPCADLRGLGLI
jgi:hypothetical protein